MSFLSFVVYALTLLVLFCFPIITLVVCACVSALCFLFWCLSALWDYVWDIPRRRRVEYAVSRLEAFLASGEDGYGKEVDAGPSDVGYDTVEEVDGACNGDGADAGSSDGNASGLGRIRRKKMVYTPYEGGILKGAYLSSIVAEVRMCSYARAYSPSNADIVRSHLVRRMREHGVRPTHISNNINKLILACFYKSDSDLEIEKQLGDFVKSGRVNVRKVDAISW